MGDLLCMWMGGLHCGLGGLLCGWVICSVDGWFTLWIEWFALWMVDLLCMWIDGLHCGLGGLLCGWVISVAVIEFISSVLIGLVF